MVIGGHDIRDGSLLDEARRMWTVSRAIPPGVLESVTPDLIDIETRLRPGTVVASGSSIQAIASLPESKAAQTPRSIIDQIRTDILDFAETNDVERVVVVNLASTEPPWSLPIPDNLDEISSLLENASESSPLPTSSLYAIAALKQMLPISILHLPLVQHRTHSIPSHNRGDSLMQAAMEKLVRHCLRVYLPQCFVIATWMS